MQIALPLEHFPYQPYLARFKRLRKALAPSNVVPAWTQLRLKMTLRKICAIAKQGFIWTREDGKQIVCKNLRTLVTRIKHYDGLNSKLLPMALREAAKPRRSAPRTLH